MKVNNPTIKAAREAYDPIRLMVKEIDREILKELLKMVKKDESK